MGVKGFSVMSLGSAKIFEPEKVGYQDSIDIIKDELQKTRRSFIKIGWYLKHIREQELYREENYQNIFDFAYDKFHLSQPTANRFIQICEEFSVNHNSPELDQQYADYSVSQLFEMLPMTSDQKEKVSPEMTVKEMRQIKKADKHKIDAEQEEIPGQTSIESDFPEYLPKGTNDTVIDGEYQEVAEKENDIYATSHTQSAFDKKPERHNIEMVSDEDAEISDPEQLVQLPLLKNNDQRKKWLVNYREWGLWYRDEHIDVNYYKYDFDDGSRLIVAEYPQRMGYWKNEKEDEYRYHLLEKNRKGYKGSYDQQYMPSTDSETYLIEFLKNVQNKR